MNSLEMDSGPRYMKPAIIGAMVLVFVGGFYAMTHSSGTPVAAAKPADAQQQSAMAGDGTAAPDAAPAATDPAAEATPGAPSSTADMTSTTAAAAPAMAAAPAPAPAEMAAAPAPKPKPMETASVAMPTPAPAAENAMAPDTFTDGDAASGNSDKVATKDQKSNRKAVRAPSPAAADVLRPWWGETASDNRFGVQYVGQAAGQPTLVIRFTRQVSDPVAMQNIKLIGSDGQPVAANWQAGQDPRVIVAPNLQPGRYTVVIDPQLSSTSGEALGTQLHGPTYIQ